MSNYYQPPEGFDGLIVDVGARDGDTAIIFARKGYKRMRLIEPDPNCWNLLEHNAKVLRKRYGCEIEILKRRFEMQDLEGAGFIKFDCEGCEHELDLRSLKIPWVAEMHIFSKPDANGRYDFVRAIGYLKGP